MINAEIVADSIGPNSDRITTFLLRYPRFIHSELMTHRAFSRNAASSRAIPIKRMIEDVKKETAQPAIWGRNQAGMQSNEVLGIIEEEKARAIWLEAMVDAANHAERLFNVGAHKQIANRLIEPFAHMVTLVTATDWTNFFALRAHKDAQPEFQILAYRMLGRYLHTTPAVKKVGEWHIPYGDRMPDGLSVEDQIKVATARAARTSYMTFDGEIDAIKDIGLHDKLTTSNHWSPAEHPAQCMGDSNYYGNFKGWKQYRKFFDTENQVGVDLQAIYDARPAHVDYH